MGLVHRLKGGSDEEGPSDTYTVVLPKTAAGFGIKLNDMPGTNDAFVEGFSHAGPQQAGIVLGSIFVTVACANSLILCTPDPVHRPLICECVQRCAGGRSGSVRRDPGPQAPAVRWQPRLAQRAV